MAEEQASIGRVDSFFRGVSNYITGTISAFVSFLFFVFTLGAVVIWIAQRLAPEFVELIILLPAVAGIIAYYNRTFAIVLFIGFLLILLV